MGLPDLAWLPAPLTYLLDTSARSDDGSPRCTCSTRKLSTEVSPSQMSHLRRAPLRPERSRSVLQVRASDRQKSRARAAVMAEDVARLYGRRPSFRSRCRLDLQTRTRAGTPWASSSSSGWRHSRPEEHRLTLSRSDTLQATMAIARSSVTPTSRKRRFLSQPTRPCLSAHVVRPSCHLSRLASSGNSHGARTWDRPMAEATRAGRSRRT